ncbi:putative disrupter of telomere silencing protein Dot5 [Xylaria flabelliformis]|nr:putative disrupter of telomere silencing protein Dot5 [Xylaria flabelliformis]KAI0858606.1 thioredoxin-like protein [Xylaria cubensis]
MPVELRKRKAPAPAPVPEPPAKKQSKVSKAAAKVKTTVKAAAAKATEANGSPKSGKPVAGDIISLDGFGGEVETNDGAKTTLKALVDESKAGVVVFTYPKASTPGCTNQVCLFRDYHADLTKEGLLVYGLSTDSPKANTTFKTKQNLQYPLLCDPSATLIEAIGLKKTPKGTTRGVFVVDKTGKVLLAEAGGPAATVDAVKKLVTAGGISATKSEAVADKPTNGQAAEDKKTGEVVEKSTE